MAFLHFTDVTEFLNLPQTGNSWKPDSQVILSLPNNSAYFYHVQRQSDKSLINENFRKILNWEKILRKRHLVALDDEKGQKLECFAHNHFPRPFNNQIMIVNRHKAFLEICEIGSFFLSFSGTFFIHFWHNLIDKPEFHRAKV